MMMMMMTMLLLLLAVHASSCVCVCTWIAREPSGGFSEKVSFFSGAAVKHFYSRSVWHTRPHAEAWNGVAWQLVQDERDASSESRLPLTFHFTKWNVGSPHPSFGLLNEQRSPVSIRGKQSVFTAANVICLPLNCRSSDAAHQAGGQMRRWVQIGIKIRFSFFSYSNIPKGGLLKLPVLTWQTVPESESKYYDCLGFTAFKICQRCS